MRLTANQIKVLVLSFLLLKYSFTQYFHYTLFNGINLLFVLRNEMPEHFIVCQFFRHYHDIVFVLFLDHYREQIINVLPVYLDKYVCQIIV